jgi:hypothetical protein
MSPDKYTLERVYFDNLRAHNIGETDGVSAEVARDMGFQIPETYDEAVALTTPAELAAVEERDASIARSAGGASMAEQRANARRFEAEHDKRSQSQILRDQHP